MSDKDKVYFYEMLLNMTIERYKENVKIAEIMLDVAVDINKYKIRINEYNNIIEILSNILKLEGK